MERLPPDHGELCWLVAWVGVGVATATVLALAGEARQVESVWDGVYSEQQADRGELLYRAVCESCHAPDLSGGKVVPELVGETFTEDWDGLMVGQLFELVLLSMPEGDPASVSSREKVDILSFILRANGFPAGNMDLQVQQDVLNAVRFEVVKP